MARELKNILANHIHNRELKRYASSYLTGRVIDIGCGTKVYRNLLAPYVDEHVGLDHEATVHDKSNVDIFGSAYKIPVADESFDSVVCAATLEHLEEPEQALRACHRILKPGGIDAYSVPFIWHFHEEPQVIWHLHGEPRDFYRYSKYGLEYLFGKVGFEMLEIRELSGFWVTFGQLFVSKLYRLNRGPLRWFWIIDAVGLLIQGFAYVLDRIDNSEPWTWMNTVVAKKPDVA